MMEIWRYNMKISMKEIKDHIIFTIKESIKFALLAVAIIFLLGLPMVYVFIEILKINGDVSSLIVGVITAIIIVIIDHKKVHSLSKIDNNRAEIFKKILE